MTITLKGWTEIENPLSIVKILKENTDFGLKDCKGFYDKVLALERNDFSGNIEIELKENVFAQNVCKELNELGIKAIF